MGYLCRCLLNARGVSRLTDFRFDMVLVATMALDLSLPADYLHMEMTFPNFRSCLQMLIFIFWRRSIIHLDNYRNSQLRPTHTRRLTKV